MSARSHRPSVRYKKSKFGKALKVAKEIHSLARNAWGIYNGVKHGDWSGVGFRRFNPYQTGKYRKRYPLLYDDDDDEVIPEDLPIAQWPRRNHVYRDEELLAMVDDLFCVYLTNNNSFQVPCHSQQLNHLQAPST